MSGSLKLSKLELLLSVAVVSLISGPIGYRVYQIYHTYSPDNDLKSSVVRVVSAQSDTLPLAEYTFIRSDDDPDVEGVAIPSVIDFNSRHFSRLSLYDIRILPPENGEELIHFNFHEIKPLYSFKENILLFSGLDNALRPAVGQ